MLSNIVNLFCLNIYIKCKYLQGSRQHYCYYLRKQSGTETSWSTSLLRFKKTGHSFLVILCIEIFTKRILFFSKWWFGIYAVEAFSNNGLQFNKLSHCSKVIRIAILPNNGHTLSGFQSIPRSLKSVLCQDQTWTTCIIWLGSFFHWLSSTEGLTGSAILHVPLN